MVSVFNQCYKIIVLREFEEKPMNKRLIAVIAGSFILQTAALAAETDSKAADCSSKVSTKKHFSLGKAVAKISGKKESKQVASNEAQVGAY
jgi:hypothetical protein